MCVIENCVLCCAKSVLWNWKPSQSLRISVLILNFEKLIHAFISVRLDYCNSLNADVSQSLLTRLQLTLYLTNAAARLLMCVRKRQRVTPIWSTLHWLPIHYRVDFKLFILGLTQSGTLLFNWSFTCTQTPKESKVIKPDDFRHL